MLGGREECTSVPWKGVDDHARKIWGLGFSAKNMETATVLSRVWV